MRDKECLALYDRMIKLDGERNRKERLATAKKYGMEDDKCPRCGTLLNLEIPGHAPCYCSACAFSPDVNGTTLSRMAKNKYDIRKAGEAHRV